MVIHKNVLSHALELLTRQSANKQNLDGVKTGYSKNRRIYTPS